MASNVCLITFTAVTTISFAATATCSVQTAPASAVFGDRKDQKDQKESKGLWGRRENRGREVYKGNRER
ncbi:hypothetical protein GCM10023196_062780 [Actinoallomurus vinaceus]|uniref:Secreted protein n=1 Tax=Actinoallomurus vinaceus TaxID=1080074 RepID=A0ABP8UGS7_9ACTN